MNFPVDIFIKNQFNYEHAWYFLIMAMAVPGEVYATIGVRISCECHVDGLFVQEYYIFHVAVFLPF
jgi:hypothetical protein